MGKLVLKSNILNGMVLACRHEISKLILRYLHEFGTESHDDGLALVLFVWRDTDQRKEDIVLHDGDVEERLKVLEKASAGHSDHLLRKLHTITVTVSCTKMELSETDSLQVLT